MLQRLVRAIALSGLVAALAACGVQATSQPTAAPQPAAPAAVEAFVGEQFVVRLGERAVLGEGGLSLSFGEVVEDSRCPANAMCVQQGQAVVAGELVAGGAPAPYRLTLGANEADAALTAGDYTVRVVALDPYPGTAEQIAPEDYRLTLLVEKAGA